MSKRFWSGSSCNISNCTREAHRFKEEYGPLCFAHAQRLRNQGDIKSNAPIQRRNQKRFHQKDGYITLKLPDHPNSNSNGYVMEHTFVMSQTIGRPLNSRESVHHRNGIRDDNRPENLELWTSSKHHNGSRITDKIQWALEILNTYGSDPSKWE